MTTQVNRLKCGISNAPGAAGDLTIGSAASGYRTFDATHNGLSFDCLFLDGTAWEVRTGCVYTHSGASLSRGTLEDSSTGSAISLSSSSAVVVTATAGWGQKLDRLLGKPVMVTNDGSTTQSFGPTVWTKVTAINSEVTDEQGWWDNTNKRFQPTVAGVYSVGYGLTITALADGQELIWSLYKNGSDHRRISRQTSAAANAILMGSGSTLIEMNGTTDYVEAYLYNGGANKNSLASVSANWFCGSLVCPA